MKVGEIKTIDGQEYEVVHYGFISDDKGSTDGYFLKLLRPQKSELDKLCMKEESRGHVLGIEKGALALLEYLEKWSADNYSCDFEAVRVARIWCGK